MSDSLTPEERSRRARLAAQTLHGTHDSRALTEKARAASPSHLRYWIAKADPDGTLDRAEAIRRAEHLRSAHYTRLAYKAARARRTKTEGKNGRKGSEK